MFQYHELWVKGGHIPAPSYIGVSKLSCKVCHMKLTVINQMGRSLIYVVRTKSGTSRVRTIGRKVVAGLEGPDGDGEFGLYGPEYFGTTNE